MQIRAGTSIKQCIDILLPHTHTPKGTHAHTQCFSYLCHPPVWGDGPHHTRAVGKSQRLTAKEYRSITGAELSAVVGVRGHLQNHLEKCPLVECVLLVMSRYLHLTLTNKLGGF